MRSACLLMLPDASCHLSFSSLSTNDLTTRRKLRSGQTKAYFMPVSANPSRDKVYLQLLHIKWQTGAKDLTSTGAPASNCTPPGGVVTVLLSSVFFGKSSFALVVLLKFCIFGCWRREFKTALRVFPLLSRPQPS